ncbi:MAG: TIGR00730 family Rossman fold protein [Myxococcota bacterium]
MVARICVFLGSNLGARPAYREAATALGGLLADRKIGLVYGGASVGLMGAVADGCLAQGGEVIGVIPTALRDRELAHPGLTRMHVVASMHERKAKMAELADAFIALPGGAGTMEELFEVWTWAQLGLHAKPCAVLNVERYYDPLIEMVDRMASEAFARVEHRDTLLVDDDPEALLAKIAAYQPPTVTKWISPSET